MAAAASGMPAQSHLVDKPTSRLSKRINRWPRDASAAQKSSSQRIICAARPMMRKSGRPSGAPKVSYAISMPLARAVVMRPPSQSLPAQVKRLLQPNSGRREKTASLRSSAGSSAVADLTRHGTSIEFDEERPKSTAYRHQNRPQRPGLDDAPCPAAAGSA